MILTDAQKQWMADHPDFGPIGPPRAVKFSEWGTLYADGTYERMDDSPRGTPIRVGNGAVGVGKINNKPERPMIAEQSFTDGLKALGNEIKATAYMDAACDCMIAAEAYQRIGNREACEACVLLSQQLRAKANALSSTAQEAV